MTRRIDISSIENEAIAKAKQEDLPIFTWRKQDFRLAASMPYQAVEILGDLADISKEIDKFGDIAKVEDTAKKEEYMRLSITAIKKNKRLLEHLVYSEDLPQLRILLETANPPIALGELTEVAGKLMEGVSEDIPLQDSETSSVVISETVISGTEDSQEQDIPEGFSEI